jgi:hypothetical protein
MTKVFDLMFLNLLYKFYQLLYCTSFKTIILLEIISTDLFYKIMLRNALYFFC